MRSTDQSFFLGTIQKPRMTSTLSVECLSLGDVTSSGKAKTAPFSVNGGPAEFTLPSLKVAFEPSAYQDEEATRVNVVFKVGLAEQP